ncbi:prephenate dehydratase [Thermococcus chitonophagus]|uniref:prephenate dehydratase n=1 Tax=Thermococcus chitonophagus TaxID=54262 RepID=A0A160VQN5_9EURY|nr:prephenate dehydratase [Thermococcus chitonophagus]ASJ15791.1 prephenate dehydratase [Thermococcus chitonophagus]CUX77020.1 Prephenate dehydratase [Thermococcus chitonophagus]
MIYALGPQGSYTEKAARIFAKLISGKVRLLPSIYDVFEAVTRKNLGVVPVENSIEGSVTLTMDLLLEFPVKIFGEVSIEIRHCLIGYNMEKIRKVVSHPQALAQCRKFIRERGWEVESVESTSTAVQLVARLKREDVAAIGPKEAAELYGVPVLMEDIQDYENNKTRFILIGHQEIENPLRCNGFPKKSSIIVELKENKPGSLYRALGEFANRGINLTRIESRPSRKDLGLYYFYIDYEFYPRDDELMEALRKHASFIKHLGTYCVIEGDLRV